MSSVFLRSANYLRTKRKEHQLTTLALGRMIGVHRGQYLGWEKGKKALTVPTIYACAEIFKTDMKDILEIVLKDKLDFYVSVFKREWDKYQKTRSIDMAPTYEYACENCEHKFEKVQSMKDKPIKKCPKCKKNKLYRVFNAPTHMKNGASKYDGQTPHRITLGNKITKRNS